MTNAPCPFCGTPLREPPLFETEYGVCVSCLECSAQGPSVVLERQDQDVFAEALDLWNRRTLGRAERIPTTIPAPLDPGEET